MSNSKKSKIAPLIALAFVIDIQDLRCHDTSMIMGMNLPFQLGFVVSISLWLSETIRHVRTLYYQTR